MLKTYLTIAYRNFFRNKIFSLINVLGLAIGISASLVIFLIVHYDFTFDKFEKEQMTGLPGGNRDEFFWFTDSQSGRPLRHCRML